MTTVVSHLSGDDTSGVSVYLMSTEESGQVGGVTVEIRPYRQYMMPPFKTAVPDMLCRGWYQATLNWGGRHPATVHDAQIYVRLLQDATKVAAFLNYNIARLMPDIDQVIADRKALNIREGKEDEYDGCYEAGRDAIVARYRIFQMIDPDTLPPLWDDIKKGGIK